MRRWVALKLDEGADASHCGANLGHFETSIIHFPTSEGVSKVSEQANEHSGARKRSE